MLKGSFSLLIMNFWIVSSSSLATDSVRRDCIYVYQDEGVSDESLNQTLATLENVLGQRFKIKKMSSDAVKEGSWVKQAALFVLPGGADLPYAKKLNGKGNAVIKAYVESGGSFLGICAGAYYASSYVEFDKGGKLEVLGRRELGFFQGKSIGPVLGPYFYQSQQGSRAAFLHLTSKRLSGTSVFYNGGGYFEGGSSRSSYKVIGYYSNHLPAIIHTRYGEGNVILSGVHFEYNPRLINSSDPYLKKIIPELIKDEQSRERLTHEIFRILKLLPNIE